jgi:hypothetical protein
MQHDDESRESAAQAPTSYRVRRLDGLGEDVKLPTRELAEEESARLQSHGIEAEVEQVTESVAGEPVLDAAPSPAVQRDRERRVVLTGQENVRRLDPRRVKRFFQRAGERLREAVARRRS